VLTISLNHKLHHNTQIAKDCKLAPASIFLLTELRWLNAAEIEINVMDIECTGRRIGDMETLAREVAAWTKRRNDQKKKINWKFTKERADKKLSKHYV